MADKKSKALVVFTTVSKKSDAKRLAEILVDKKLAACVTTLPQGESRYHWKGKLCVDKEFILMIKTKSGVFAKLRKAIEETHPYDCPEIIGLPIDKISKPYFDWLKINVKN